MRLLEGLIKECFCNQNVDFQKNITEAVLEIALKIQLRLCRIDIV
jgi:hypothetical protein